jgi:Luciferase-like monooxygenase
MQIGAVYPQNELRGDPTAVGRIGKAVEDLGFDYLVAYDHVLGAVHAGRARQLTGPYTERDPFHDPFVMFAYLAGITERIGFATGVLVLPQRQTSRTGPSSLAAARSGDHEALLPGLRPTRELYPAETWRTLVNCQWPKSYWDGGLGCRWSDASMPMGHKPGGTLTPRHVWLR